MIRGKWAEKAQRKELLGKWADTARTLASKPVKAMRSKGRARPWQTR